MTTEINYILLIPILSLIFISALGLFIDRAQYARKLKDKNKKAYRK